MRKQFSNLSSTVWDRRIDSLYQITPRPPFTVEAAVRCSGWTTSLRDAPRLCGFINDWAILVRNCVRWFRQASQLGQIEPEYLPRRAAEL